MKWICCQLGAREHYAVPRALQLTGSLDEFITDIWSPFTGRFHPSLANARVVAPNAAALRFELKAYVTRANGWKLIHKRNEWFQQRALEKLQKQPANGPRTVFAYSYAAEGIFEFARARGWRTVLGQIDPGPAEERVKADREPAPEDYWNRWRTECALADQIVVNSAWSRDALLNEGVPGEKIRVLPLAYEPTRESKTFQRQYPKAFTAERPLRVLFLGQVNLRKGVGHLLEAVELLASEHVEFWFVGPRQINVPPELGERTRVKWFGAVPRADVDKYYKDADVFVFPTLSDGFGLTQLEAQSWRLPVVASRHCGEVVRDGVNGVILEEVSGQAIADVLLNLLHSPELLSSMSANSTLSDRFSLKTLAASLVTL